MKRPAGAVFAFLVAASVLPARTWTNSEGRQLEADYVSDDGAAVTVKKPDGTTFVIPLTKLCAADQALVKQLHQPAAPMVGVEAAQERFSPFDYGVAAPGDGKADGFVLNHWAMIEVRTQEPLERKAMETSLRSLLGAHRVLSDLGFPDAALPDAKHPLSLTLLASEAEVAKLLRLNGTESSMALPDGRVAGPLAAFGIATPTAELSEKRKASRVRDSAEAMLAGATPFVPRWLSEAAPDFAAALPWIEDWPQCSRAKTTIKKLLADAATKKEYLITPGQIDELLAQPDATLRTDSDPASQGMSVHLRSLRAAATLTLYYLRYLHGDGKGAEFKKVLAEVLPHGAQWRDHLQQVAKCNAVWDQILADPRTQKLPEGGYRFPSSYEPPERPENPLSDEAIVKLRHAMADRINQMMGPHPGQTVVAALRKAGLTDAIADDAGALASSPSSSSYTPRNLTPDYSKAAPPKPHPPLEGRSWPVQISVGTGSVVTKTVSKSAGGVVYQVGDFELQTGPDLSAALVTEIGRTFMAVEELIERLPWDLPPSPPDGKRYLAKLYESRSAYDKIAPPSSGGFYDQQEKVFHVPYQSLGIESKGGVWTKTTAFNSDTLVHELTHMFMDRVIRHVPIWAAEGSAEYVETIPFENGVMRTGELPKAMAAYIKHMTGIPVRARAQYRVTASAKRMAEVMHLSEKAWHAFAGTTRVKDPEPLPPGFVVIPGTPGSGMPPVEIMARQIDLYMHSCLLYYYFLHLDSRQRGDPMLHLLDQASDLAPKWRLFEDAMGEYQKEFKSYRAAWEAFASLPGVTRTGDGRIQYPASMTPPSPPKAPDAPIDLTKLPDSDLRLALIDVVIKGRTDDQLIKSFRDGFATIGIKLD